MCSYSFKELTTAECSKVKMSSVPINVLKIGKYTAFTMTSFIGSYFNGKGVRCIKTLHSK
jgi:hypothetical protein